MSTDDYAGGGQKKAQFRRVSKLAALAELLMAGVSLSANAAETPPNPMPAEWQDPLYTKPFVDVDEWRDVPVRHRYVHGGFRGTDLLFSIYFPPKEQYQGRFFQPLPAMNGSENTAQFPPGQLFSQNMTNENTTIGFAVSSGAFLVESNQGSKTKYPNDDRTVTGYRASAAAAKFARELAQKMYGPRRVFGYAYGGSGGAYKTLSLAQNTVGIWDGYVPYVLGSSNAMPMATTIQAHALRILTPKMPQIVNAVDPGGSGDMYAGLNTEERAALREATLLGVPPRIWFNHDNLGYGPLGGLIDDLVKFDPSYFSHDFWTVPGYLGADRSNSLQRARITSFRTTVKRIVMSDEAKRMGTFRITSAAVGNNIVPAAFELTQKPGPELKGATITFRSGGAVGQKVSATGEAGDLVTIDIGPDAFAHMKDVKVGDEVEIDNSIFLAAQTYHRHQVPTPDLYPWNQYRGPDGEPLYPQRPRLFGPWVAERASASVPDGTFHGKVILVESMVDEYAYAWSADWYRGRVTAHLGPRTDSSFRLWYTDNAMHGSPPPGAIRTRIVTYTPVLQQALRDLSAWVEKGTSPPPTTSYKVVDSQIILAPTAAERHGIQPVVTLTANGTMATTVKVGEPVRFQGSVEAPPNTGQVVRAEWDFDGRGDYPVKGQVVRSGASGARATVAASYAFAKPGIYFPALRAASQRAPDGTPYAQIENLARVRVLVR